MDNLNLPQELFSSDSKLDSQLLFNISLQNIYNRGMFNVSDPDASNYTELEDKYKVLLRNYLQKLYLLQGKQQLFDVPWTLKIVLSLLYGAISVTSLIGNGLVTWMVLGSRKMRTVTNLFISNLAVADLIIGLLVVPFHFQAALLQRWHLPHFLCALCPFFQVLGVNLNVLTLSTIAVDRYRAVLKPLAIKTTKRKAMTSIAVIWMLSLVLAIPTYLDYKVVLRSSHPFAPPRKFCHTVLFSPETRMIYNMGLSAVQYVIPVLIISFAYVRMGIHLWGRTIPGNQEKSRDAILLKNKKQAIKTLALVVLLFGLCWFPFQVYSFLQYVIPAINHYQYINIIWFSMHWLAMSNSCVNPFVYAVHNESFQKEFCRRVSFWRLCVCFTKKVNGNVTSGSEKNRLGSDIRLRVVKTRNHRIPGSSSGNSQSSSRVVSKRSTGFTESSRLCPQQCVEKVVNTKQEVRDDASMCIANRIVTVVCVNNTDMM